MCPLINSWHLLNRSSELGTKPGNFLYSLHVALESRHSHVHFTDQETEAQRSQAMGQGSPASKVQRQDSAVRKGNE